MRRLLMLLAVLLLAEPAAAQETTVVLVRHAEKVDESADAALSAAGLARAAALGAALEHAGVRAIFVTQFQRTRGTAEPLATRLGLEAVGALGASVQLTPAGAGVVMAEGTIRAHVTQTCAVSLEPFEQTLEVPLRLIFRPGSEDDLAADQTVDPEAEDEVPYEGSRFDLGESVVETLALSLDPWPRRPGAVLDVPSPQEAPADGPFAALARRRKG